MSSVKGTGNFGRVTEADVLAALGEAPKGAKGGDKSEEDPSGMSSREAPVLPNGPKVRVGKPLLFSLFLLYQYIFCVLICKMEG